VTWIAYGDESMRHRPHSTGLYVLAAVVFDAADMEGLRAEARQLGQRGRFFHWRDESTARRRKAVAAVASLDALHFVVVGTGLDGRRQERGRRQCLTRMLWELGDCGVDEVRLDARRPEQNDRDIALVDALRARGQIRDGVRLNFVRSATEPLVWLSDIVAGAVSAARGDGDDQYVTMLEKLLTEHTIELD
jgi:hypothetical protein